MNSVNRVRQGSRLTAVVAAALLATFASDASAQLTRIGNTREVATLASGIVRGVDIAFDPVANVYMVVGGQNAIAAQCVNSDGTNVGSPITIKGSSGAFGAYPRARYSRHANGGAGAFLVVWPEETNQVTLKARMVSCSGVLGAERAIASGHTAWLESGAAIAYSETSQQFLVVWKSFPPDVRVKAQLIDVNGAAVGSVVNLSSGFARDPGVTWNADRNEFGVSFSGELQQNCGNSPIAYSAFVRVPAGNISGFSRETFNTLACGLTTITDVAYNPTTRNYVMTWFEYPGPYTRVAEFDAATGALVTTGIASSTLGSYDALGLDYNPASGTFLLVGVERANDDVVAAELNYRGYRSAAENTISSSTRPARYPRVASSTLQARWNATFNVRNFLAVANQVVESSSRGGGAVGVYGAGSSSGSGSGGSTPAPTPTPTPTPSACPSVQPGPTWQCSNGNWLPPSAEAPAPSPTPTPSPTPSPSPTPANCSGNAPVSGWVCVGSGWLPPDHPLALNAPVSTPTPTPTPTPGTLPFCSSGTPPVGGWVRLANSDWVPPSHPLAAQAVCRAQ